MSDISAIGGGASASGLPRPLPDAIGRAGARAEPRSARRGDDQVEVSSLARSLSRLTSDEPVRQDLIDRVRSEIESGSYETPEKIDGAVDGLLRELGG
jgi:anti-sigma28 factor (negative regulator of flagellin synthesis)